MRGAAACLVLCGCFGNESTHFPDGLEPLEENVAPWPEDGAEEVAFESGERGDVVWVHARGYVRAPLAATWEALRDPDVCADRRAVADYDVEWDVEDGYDFSYRIHNVVEDVITVEFEVTWRQGVVEGTIDEPALVSARFQKTWGTTTITSMEGSILLRSGDGETTEVEMIEHLDAMGGGVPALKSYLEDLHHSVVEVAHGRTLPDY